MINSKELEVLLPLLQEGNHEAQRTLFEKCYSAVSDYVLKRSRSKTDCEEIVSETFYRCFKDIKRFAGGNFKGWLFKLAYNSAVDYYRVKDSGDSFELLTKEIIEIVPTRKQDDPLEILLRKEWFEKFYEVINKLSLKDRNFIISLLEGMSIAELAEIMSVSVESVWQRVHRVRVRLLNILADEPYFGDDEKVNQFIKRYKIL